MSDEKGTTNRLEDLPDEVKIALDTLIAKGYGAIRVKQVLEEKYQDKSSILPASQSTYARYLDIHRERIEKETKLTKDLASDANESIDDMKNFVEVVADKDSSKEDRRAVFESVVKNLELQRLRIDKILSNQQGILSPQYESVLVQIERERRNTAAKMQELESVLQRNEEEDLLKAINEFIDRIIDTAVLRAYEEVNDNKNSLEFQSRLNQYWTEAWEAFIAERKKYAYREDKERKKK